jgi:hypothetical protein
MQGHRSRIKSVIASFVIAAVCLLSFPTAAQQTGSQIKQGMVSDDDFISLQQQIKELKNPTFRAFLRIRLLSWESPHPSPTRRQAAMAVATQGVVDLCEHQDEVWPATASWLHGSFVKRIKTLQLPEDTLAEICAFKTETKSSSATDLSSGIKMFSDPERSAAGLNLAKSAILSGQVSADAMLGQLLSLKMAQSPRLPELLSAVVSLEEQHPGTLPLRMLPFFSSMFLDKSVAPEILTRFLFVAVRSSRLPAEELANSTIRGLVTELLNGIIKPAQQLAPALYPEIAGRLNSLNTSFPNRSETRLAAEERIQKATDQLEQLISEADSASEEELKKQFFFRAARLAKEQGQLSRAVDLALKVENDNQPKTDASTRSWLNDFLSEVVSLAVKKKTTGDAIYAISKMTQPLGKANAFRLLGDFYGESRDNVKSKEAFTQSAKQLKGVDNDNEKVKTSLLLAESVFKYEPADAYEGFREAVKAINNLPSAQKDQEKIYSVKLLPIAEDLIRSFRLFATRENQTATSLAAEIKLSELRLSALSGVYSGHEVIADKKSDQE